MQAEVEYMEAGAAVLLATAMQLPWGSPRSQLQSAGQGALGAAAACSAAVPAVCGCGGVPGGGQSRVAAGRRQQLRDLPIWGWGEGGGGC